MRDLLHILKRVFTGKTAPRVLLFIQLPQDLDLVLPVLEILKTKQIPTETLVTEEAARNSPRITRALTEGGHSHYELPQRIIRHGRLPRLAGVKAILFATESTAGPHRVAHFLAKRANEAKIPTFTLQHGFDNIGLTYFDNEYPPHQIEIASQRILIWGDRVTLDARVSDSIRSRCETVGFPKPKPLATSVPLQETESELCVAIFENLHWSRYDEPFRQSFVRDIFRLAEEHPNTHFILKPHHAGKWATEKAKLSHRALTNLEFADPRDPKWEPFTAPALLSFVDGVITTPSTVAVDAVRAECPVAVAAYHLDADRYKPLPLLKSYEDYRDFLNTLQGEKRTELLKYNQAFQEKYLAHLDGDSRIANLLSDAFRGGIQPCQ